MRGGLLFAAPCKINLHLAVFDRRADSFHDLESLFQALSFGDELWFESLKERSVCELRMDGSVPPEQNSIVKAVTLFRSVTGFDGGLRITVDKRIPMGAGLGGGSSDAAATLAALDSIAGTALPKAALHDMACRLGSDVPFFLSAATALVGGRGDRIRPVRGPADLSVVLVNPGFHSDTAAAFRVLDRAREGGLVPPCSPLGESVLLDALGSHPGGWPFFNDFLPAFLALLPEEEASAYRGMLADLRRRGADFAGLSGSGSTCFGVFADPKAAERAVSPLSEAWNRVHLTFPLARPVDAVVQ